MALPESVQPHVGIEHTLARNISVSSQVNKPRGPNGDKCCIQTFTAPPELLSDGSCDALPSGYSSDCCHGQRIFTTVMICPLNPCTPVLQHSSAKDRVAPLTHSFVSRIRYT
jgi:hypothetical protein